MQTKAKLAFALVLKPVYNKNVATALKKKRSDMVFPAKCQVYPPFLIKSCNCEARQTSWHLLRTKLRTKLYHNAPKQFPFHFFSFILKLKRKKRLTKNSCFS